VRSVRIWWVVFHNASTFNSNVSEWNVGQVTNMKYSKSYLLN
jgi:surface protein